MDNTDKILVTGATGLVGTHIMLELLSKGYHVCALKRSASDTSLVKQVFAHYDKTELFDNIEWRNGDVTEPYALTEAFSGITAVCNAAAMVSFSANDYERMWQVNVEGTANVVTAAIDANVKTFCHISSIGAIGHTSDGSLIDEKTPFQPESNRTVYSQSKFRQEMEVWKGMENGLRAFVINPGVVIGPCAATRSSGLIAKTMQRGTMFYTEGATGYVDARDVAKAAVMLMESEVRNERYLLVGENSTVRNIQNMFANNFGTSKPTHKAPKWLLNIVAALSMLSELITNRKAALTFESVQAIGGEHAYNNEKIRNATDIKFYTLDQSVANMASFFKKQK